MARKNETFEIFSKQLVTSLTNFTEDEENFNLCMDYVSSNFKYHKFLGPDSHKIKRVIEGLCDKFMVHCQEKKANTFKKLVDQFLEIPAFEHRENGKTETHWAVLSLLLTLSDSPTNAVYREKKKKVKQEEKDNFDWTAHLLDGEDVYIEPDYGSPEMSDDSEEESESYHPHVRFKDMTIQRNEGAVTAEKFVPVEAAEDIETDETWLERNLIVQYWDGKSTFRNSGHRSSKLNQDWEDHLISSSDIYVPPNYTVVTEYQVVRETLWLMNGATSSFVYKICDNQCTVNDGVRLSHLTQASLHASLGSFCKYANIVSKLHHFVDVTASANMFCKVESADDNVISQTYQAFGNCVSRYLTDFKKTLVVLEKQAKAQDEPATISALMKQLQPFFGELDLLSHILTNGIDACSHVTRTPQKASHLLAVIYDTLLLCDSMGDYSNDHVSFLLPLWVESSKPYLSIIDNWLCNGVLMDPRREFIIQRNTAVQCLDETFWSTAFTMYTTPVKSKPCDNANAGIDSDYTIQYAPTFLIPVLHSVIMAGKSMEMLENLGKKAEFVEDRDKTSKRKTLYQNFIASMESFLGTSKDHLSEAADRNKLDDEKNKAGDNVFFKNINQQMEVKEVKDPLLRKNFASIIQTHGTFKSLTEKDENVHKQLESIQFNGTSPIQLVLERCLYPHITRRYDSVCTGLLHIMKEEFHLMDYLAAIRKFYLMEAGDTMYDFYTEIFEKLRHKEPWKDVSYLNMLLEEALQAHYPQEIDRLSVVVSSSERKGRDKMPVNALEGLQLHYKVPWPVDVVLNETHMATYNKVFTFLLMIKRTKYGLDELRFTDLEKPDILQENNAEEATAADLTNLTSPDKTSKTELLHKMQILRMKLLTFVNGLHNYIMTRILYSTGLEFQANIEKATDLDDLIYVHSSYLKKIHERCLQHEDIRIIKDVVTKIFNLAIKFQGLWDEGVDHLNKTIIGNMESEFSKFMMFLSSIMTNAIKRGSFQHLESLAFAILSFSDTKKTQH